MAILIAALILFVLYPGVLSSTPPCYPLTTNGLCAASPGTMSSDGFDDVCVLVPCCNAASPASVETPSGSMIFCFNVNCKSVCSLANQRSLLGNEACDSTCVPFTFDWGPLVQRACNDYNQAKSVAPQTLGYFGQILNIVCAAAKSMDPCCSDMISSYNNDGCSASWAGPFMQYVFNSFLGPNSPPFNTALEIANEGTAFVLSADEPGLLLVGIGPNEFGSLLAGGEHFFIDLNPAFKSYVDMLVQYDAATCDALDLSNQISALQTEHNFFFKCAVGPGFTVEGNRGQISPVAVSIAQNTVPWAAGGLRSSIVDGAYNQFYEPACGQVPTGLPAKRTAGSRQFTNNSSPQKAAGSQPPFATFLNMTAPQGPPLEYDPRAWVPTTEVPPSAQTLPFTHLQILPNSSTITIEAGSNDTGTIQISADRSFSYSEATAALSINSASGNSSDPSALITAYLVPNSTLYVFGLIASIFPSTAAIGNNSFLFDDLGLNSSTAQYLNQSSYVNDGYNTLFDTFNLSMSYTQLPSGVTSNQLVLVDLVSGNVANSSQIDTETGFVNAEDVNGYPGAWGGGGIYAVGFQGGVGNGNKTVGGNTTVPTPTGNKTGTGNTTTPKASLGEAKSGFGLVNLISIAGLTVLGSLLL